MPSAKLPLKSLYLIGAVSPFIKDRDYELEDICILSNLDTFPDQLKYICIKDDNKHLTIKHYMSYVLIDEVNTYYKFMNAFFDDYSLDKAVIPEKLDKEFMCYLNKSEADKKVDELTKLEDQYFNSLIAEGQVKAEKLKIISFDLPEMLGKFNMSKVLTDATGVKKTGEKA